MTSGPDPPPIRGCWTITQRRPMTPGAVSDWHVATGPDPGRHGRVEVVPVPDEAAIERGARHMAEKRWAILLHPYRWDEVTEMHRDAYRRDAEEFFRAALEAPEKP